MPHANRISIRCFAIALLIGLLFLPVAIPLRVVVLACASLIWTWFEAGSLQPIGIGRRRVPSTLIWGFGLALAVIVAGKVVQPFIEQLTGLHPDYSLYRALAGNAKAVIQLLGFALFSAAISEEIVFRGFLLHQLTAILGSGTWARWISILAGGALFGLAHFIQGPLGVFNTGIVGVIFG